MIGAVEDERRRLVDRHRARAGQGIGDLPGVQAQGLDAELAERVGIGFAPKRWDGALKALSKEKISAQVGETAGLAIARDSGGHYDRFRARVMFPIRDVRGWLVCHAVHQRACA